MRLRVAVALLVFCALGSACAEEAAAPPDARLEQKVTYDAKGLPVYKVLDELTEKTGVVMTAGMNEKDWKVRDRKVSLFAKNMTLGDVQKTLGKLLHFTWARSQKDGAYTYRLFQDLKSRKEEEALLAGDAAEQAKKLAEKRTAIIDQLDNLKNLSPEEIAKLKEEQPFLYMMAKEPFGQALGGVLQSIPGARDSLATGTDVSVPMNKMPLSGVTAAENMITGLENMMSKFGQGNVPSHSDLLNNIDQAQVKLQFSGSDMPLARDNGFLGMLEISAPGSRTFHLPLMDPSGPMANMMARALIKANEGETPESIRSQMMAEAGKLFGKTQPGATAEEDLPKDDPALDKEVKLETADPTMPAVLDQLAKKSEMNVLSDYFVDRRPRTPQASGKLRDVLKSIAATYDKHLSYTAGLITFEDKKWFEKRSWEVPEAWLEQWRTQAKEGKMTFDDEVSIACLTDAQIDHTIVAEQAIVLSIGPALTRNKNMLRLYAVLTPTQKSATLSQAGLDLLSLSDSQWEYFVALDRVLATSLQEGSKCTLYQEIEGVSKDHMFTIKTAQPTQDGTLGPETPKNWRVPTPQKGTAGNRGMGGEFRGRVQGGSVPLGGPRPQP